MSEDQNIKITGEPSLDPMVCKFIVDRPLLSEGSFNCRRKDMAEGKTVAVPQSLQSASYKGAERLGRGAE